MIRRILRRIDKKRSGDEREERKEKKGKGRDQGKDKTNKAESLGRERNWSIESDKSIEKFFKRKRRRERGRE